MKRRSDWSERLSAYLHAIRAVPYDALAHNCGHFALGALEAVTGTAPADVLARLQMEMPASEFSLKRLLAERGDMGGIARAFLGEPSDAPARARRGDLALFDGIDGDAIGVVESAEAICLTPEGLWTRPLSEARGFWKIG